MAKKFNFRGLELEPLQKLSNDELLKILPSRQRRFLLRANFNDSKRSLIAEIKDTADGKSKKIIKTHIRDLIILPYMIGVTVNVFSGKEFKPVVLSIEMIGHSLGEYVITNKKVSHGAPGVGASRSSLYVPLK
ncbi:MAG: 30S ribosomal protein S19 [Candidatus Nitrosoabyssus spongiisocia]|nr:MAG: 30S ribosomal protein S19 [Nitrosopumilaceae archaeon AB1(1)]